MKINATNNVLFLAIFISGIASAATWKYGGWGPNSGTCHLRTARGHTADAETYRCGYKGFKACGHMYGGNAATREVEVRAKSFSFNSWGYSGFAPSLTLHDCGTFDCGFKNCRVRIYD
ncbi:MAG: hypothetical protein IPJ65_21765 [Archangiaceae bacterium]|nr:hypothetical protein [Archangiaceae bacterium]